MGISHLHIIHDALIIILLLLREVWRCCTSAAVDGGTTCVGQEAVIATAAWSHNVTCVVAVVDVVDTTMRRCCCVAPTTGHTVAVNAVACSVVGCTRLGHHHFTAVRKDIRQSVMVGHVIVHDIAHCLSRPHFGHRQGVLAQ